MQHDRRQTYPRKLCALLGTLQGLNGRVLSSAVSKHFRPVQLDIRSVGKEKEKSQDNIVRSNASDALDTRVLRITRNSVSCGCVTLLDEKSTRCTSRM